MTNITRRQFLRYIALVTGASALDQFLTACGVETSVTAVQNTPVANKTSTPLETQAPPAINQPGVPTEEASSPSPVAEGLAPDLVVSRGADPEELVRRSLAALGGMQRFVPSGSRVVIKPNICVAYHSYEYAATTNPWVVGALVKLCHEAGAKSVRVMDNPFGGTPEQAYTISGIEDQVKVSGGQMVVMPNFGYVKTDISNGVDLRQCDIHDEVLNADVLINVPIAKHHSLARLTLGMKNLMGIIKDRPAMHRNLGQRLADLTSQVTPTLTVIDAIRMLMANGPTGGSLDDVKQADTIIVSPDIVAADSYAATLFGLAPENLEYINAAVQMQLGRNDLNNLRVEEIDVGV